MNSFTTGVRAMIRIMQKILVPLAFVAIGFVFGMLLLPGAPDPVIQLKKITVEPSIKDGRTNLHITTEYDNTGCSQTLLTRFLLNTRPMPSIALPQRQGPKVLPVGQTVLVEDVQLDFLLGEGNWHLFSVASCYLDGDPVPAAMVAPTALFDVAA